MTDPLTLDDLEGIRAEHRCINWRVSGPRCRKCLVWPCDAVRLLDEVERLRKVVN